MRRFAAAALALWGCEDPLKEAQDLREPRVLAVRVVAADDFATVEPGQRAALDLLIAGPDGTLDARLAYRFCEAAATDRGVPYCEGDSFAEGGGDLNGTPLELAVPETAPAQGQLALLGVACLAGEPMLSEQPLGWRCGSGDAALRWSFDVRSESGGRSHRNPDLSAAAVEIDGLELALEDARVAATCGETAASIAAGRAHRVELDLGEGAREPDEALQVSTFSSAGHFERQYSFVAPGDPSRVVLGLRAPAAGSAVKQYAVIRDGRGGVSWLSWSFCAR